MNEIQAAIDGVEAAWLEVLYTRAAVKLTGRPVILEWRKPIIPGARGCTVKRSEDLVVMIAPDLDPDQKLETFLHELAHCLLHESGLIDEKNYQDLPEEREKRGYRYPDWVFEARARAHEKREMEARDQVKHWLFIAGSGSVKDKLLRLLEV